MTTFQWWWRRLCWFGGGRGQLVIVVEFAKGDGWGWFQAVAVITKSMDVREMNCVGWRMKIYLGDGILVVGMKSSSESSWWYKLLWLLYRGKQTSFLGDYF
ncbi:hypothetical protein QVD17_06918 [Tagetes erecta]|uniref:Uncharacterized protein n=1 Tax=Tagetes erecta TaxID=13708 RepID=A0AAD8LL59_TARER|nr:hypothetical protein QVD17_06918 [Tagetes erecta]